MKKKKTCPAVIRHCGFCTLKQEDCLFMTIAALVKLKLKITLLLAFRSGIS